MENVRQIFGRETSSWKIPFSRALYVVSRRPRCIGSMSAASAGVIEKNGPSKAPRSSLKKWPPRKGIYRVISLGRGNIRESESYSVSFTGTWVMKGFYIQTIPRKFRHRTSPFHHHRPKSLCRYSLLGKLQREANYRKWHLHRMTFIPALRSVESRLCPMIKSNPRRHCF